MKRISAFLGCLTIFLLISCSISALAASSGDKKADAYEAMDDGTIRPAQVVLYDGNYYISHPNKGLIQYLSLDGKKTGVLAAVDKDNLMIASDELNDRTGTYYGKIACFDGALYTVRYTIIEMQLINKADFLSIDLKTGKQKVLFTIENKTSMSNVMPGDQEYLENWAIKDKTIYYYAYDKTNEAKNSDWNYHLGRYSLNSKTKNGVYGERYAVTKNRGFFYEGKLYFGLGDNKKFRYFDLADGKVKLSEVSSSVDGTVYDVRDGFAYIMDSKTKDLSAVSLKDGSVSMTIKAKSLPLLEQMNFKYCPMLYQGGKTYYLYEDTEELPTGTAKTGKLSFYQAKSFGVINPKKDTLLSPDVDFLQVGEIGSNTGKLVSVDVDSICGDYAFCLKQGFALSLDGKKTVYYLDRPYELKPGAKEKIGYNEVCFEKAKYSDRVNHIYYTQKARDAFRNGYFQYPVEYFGHDATKKLTRYQAIYAMYDFKELLYGGIKLSERDYEALVIPILQKGYDNNMNWPNVRVKDAYSFRLIDPVSKSDVGVTGYITREEFSQIINFYFLMDERFGVYSTYSVPQADLSKYSDSNKIDSKYKKFMSYMVAIEAYGKDEKTLRPKDNITIEEMVIVMDALARDLVENTSSSDRGGRKSVALYEEAKIDSLPTKLVYLDGQCFDPSGFSMTYTNSKGKKVKIGPEDCIFTIKNGVELNEKSAMTPAAGAIVVSVTDADKTQGATFKIFCYADAKEAAKAGIKEYAAQTKEVPYVTSPADLKSGNYYKSGSCGLTLISFDKASNTGSVALAGLYWKNAETLKINGVYSAGDKKYYCTTIKSDFLDNALAKDGVSARNKFTLIELGNSVTKIEARAFAEASELKTVLFHGDVTSIGDEAFYNCNHLQRIIFNGSALLNGKIGKNAFAKIPANCTVYVPEKDIESFRKALIKAGAPKGIHVEKVTDKVNEKYCQKTNDEGKTGKEEQTGTGTGGTSTNKTPSITKLSSSTSKTVYIEWKQVDNAAYYEVAYKRKTVSGDGVSSVYDGKKSSATQKLSYGNVVYVVRMRALDSNKKAISEWTAWKEVKIK